MIRSAHPEDAATVTDLAVASGLFSAQDSHITDTMMQDYFASGREKGHLCLMLEQQGIPVGVVYALPKPATSGTWEVLMICVHPDHQGLGLGRKLMKHVEDQLQTSGGRMILVETSGTVDFEPTRRFYEQCGYTVEAQVRDYYDAGVDMVLYCKRFPVD